MFLAEPFTTSSHSSDYDNSVLDPLIVCGPSGVGKGTIIAKFMEELGGDRHFGFTVSHTTRAPRVGEVEGIHYHFVDIEDMRLEVARGAFLEHAEVHSNMYGTSWSALRDVQKKGKHCLLDIDVQGVQRVKTMETDILKPKYIFIAPPSLEILEKRLASRGTESSESLARRTQNAREEVQYGAQDGNFHAVIVNDSLDQAVEDFAAAVSELYGL
jgi:guanylate kinase